MTVVASSSSSSGLPEGLWLAYYGDDFTGSTDVLEAFTAAGVPTVLFFQAPRLEDLARFPEARCVGVAGLSRGKSPDWMQEHLPPIFQRLMDLGAPVVQYKVCSTFDSSPTVGSIGQALDLGVPLTQAHWSPMIVGAPRLQRYQVFGQLFAAAQGQVWRIDRHPTMSRHPVTPMAEADLGLHLSAQTARRIGLVNLAQMTQGQGDATVQSLSGRDQPVVMLDVAEPQSQLEAGRLVWAHRGPGVFSASSSGLEYALTAYWHSRGWLPDPPPGLPALRPVKQIAAVSGSCSPMSAAQIAQAERQGFATRRLVVARLLGPGWNEEVADAASWAVQAVGQGRSPLVYSARGPEDAAVLSFEQDAWACGLSKSQATDRIGLALAEVMKRILDQTALRRVVVAGGDSSGAVAMHLGIQALTAVASLAPGVPMCRAWSDDPRRDGLEIALKGGQLGAESFY